MTTVLLAGAVANRPFNGGGAWVRSSWAKGLAGLGFDVFFVEEVASSALSCSGRPAADLAGSDNLSFFRTVMTEAGLCGRAGLVCDSGRQIEGLGLGDLFDVAEDASVLVNLGGHLRWSELLRRCRRRVYVDLDPGFTQLWHAQGLDIGLQRHNAFLTVGANLGAPGCSIPTGDISWRAIRQPVVLEDWPAVEGTTFDRFTTVGSLRGPFGPVQLDGRSLGSKVHELRRFAGLPRRSTHPFEAALRIDPADGKDERRLREAGWRLVDPLEVASDQHRFRSYVAGSGAEFSVAQNVYVAANTGWFSDRSVRYLASGRPVVVQDTGFTRSIPAGQGVMAFRDQAEAVAATDAVVRDYASHSRAARALAEELFAAPAVLTDALDKAGVS